jgi:hypothetical protein
MDSADFATSNEVGVAFGKIPVFINDSNDIVQIDKNDYDPNTMVPCMNKNGNMSVIENSTGKLIRIMNCEYDTAIHTHPTKNKCTMKSVKTGEIVSLDVSDERVVSGEFVGVTAGQSSVAYNYTFFDETGSIKFVHNSKFGSIGEFMIANNLPVGPFSKSYQRGGAPIFQKVGSNMTRLIESGNIKYKGWYCKQEKHDA